MHALLIPAVIFLVSGGILAGVTFLAPPLYVLHWVVIGLLVVALISLRGFRSDSTKTVFVKWGKWWMLFLVTLVVPLVVFSTGSIYSPFLVLLHFTILGIAFFFGFFIALVFLFVSILILGLSTFVNPVLLEGVMQDPVTIALYAISFVTLIPIVWLLAQHYRAKDRIFELLRFQVHAEESIMQSLDEMIFLTDLELNIFSINEAVVRVLNSGRAELLHRPLFEVIYLKHQSGGLANASNLAVHEIITQKTARVYSDLLLVATEMPIQRVRLAITPILNMNGECEQLSFVVVSEGAHTTSTSSHQSIEQARIREEALVEDLKEKLFKKGMVEMGNQLLLVEKLGDDISITQAIQDYGIASDTGIVDLSRVCRRIVALEEIYAHAFNVPLEFSIADMGELSSTLQKPLQGVVEQSTDPFFTVRCNFTYVGILVEKLVDLCVLLSSHSFHPGVHFVMKAERSDLVVITIIAKCPEVPEEKLMNVFLQGYGEFREWSNFQFGSGLEGYLAKTIATYLDLPLEIHYNRDTQDCVVTLQVARDVKMMSSAQPTRPQA